MQNILMHIFVQIGQRALEKSRAYYFPPTYKPKTEWDELDDAEFETMIKDIDTFSVQFRAVQAVSETHQMQANKRRGVKTMK